ncbi:hypothetical protein M8831_34020, partial [Pseudomonas aeruginosa]
VYTEESRYLHFWNMEDLKNRNSTESSIKEIYGRSLAAYILNSSFHSPVEYPDNDTPVKSH